MEIVFSRHAKRRLGLYLIEETDIIAALESGLAQAKITGNHGVMVDQALAGKYVFPVKIVFVLEHGKLIVVTAYPLKKGLMK